MKNYIYKLAFWVAVLFFTQLISVIAWIRSEQFPRTSNYFYDVLLSQRFTVRGQASDILIIGDSSALSGVIPDEFRKLSAGMTAYNLALVGYSGEPSYRLAMKAYLAANAPPRAVILYIAASNPTNNATAFGYERTVTLLRHATAKELLAYLLHRPASFFSVSNELMNRVFKLAFDVKGGYFNKISNSLDAQNGYMNFDEPPLSTDCSLNNTISKADTSYIDRLRREAGGAKLFVYIAPSPECQNAIEQYRDVFRGIIDNQIQTLPSGLFRDAVHPTKSGALETTRLFAEWAKSRKL